MPLAAEGLLMPDFLSLYVSAYYLERGKSIFMNIFGEEVVGVRLYVHRRQTVSQSGIAHSLLPISFLLTFPLKIYSTTSASSTPH